MNALFAMALLEDGDGDGGGVDDFLLRAMKRYYDH
jgi:hypothetical protein